MDEFLIRYSKIFMPKRLAYHTRQDQSDDTEKMDKPLKMSIHFEGLQGL